MDERYPQRERGAPGASDDADVTPDDTGPALGDDAAGSPETQADAAPDVADEAADRAPGIDEP